MIIKRTHFKNWPVSSAVTAFFWLTTFTGAQSMVAQNPTRDNDDKASAQDRDINRQEPARFDQFLDNHREIAEQVRKDPSLLNNEQFVKNHPELRTYLRDHPAVRQEIKENPSAFMNREGRFDRREDARNRSDRDVTRQEMARFDGFLDGHREIDRQLRNNPSLLNDQQYLSKHPELETYLKDHPAVQQQITQNPNAFMQREQRYDQSENNRQNDVDHDANRDRDNDANRADRDANRDNDARRANQDANRDDNAHNTMRRSDRDSDRQEMARFNDFLDSHRETAEQLRKNPSLANNQQFLKEHPALQSYLQSHPGIRDEIKDNPNAFMQQEAENRYDQRDRATGRQDYSMGRGDRDSHVASFREFLGNHSNVSQQLSKDPTLVKDQEYMHNHPELQSYLNEHPEVRQELMANPPGFVKSSQQFNGNGQQGVKTTAPGTPDPTKPASPTADPTKPKP